MPLQGTHAIRVASVLELTGHHDLLSLARALSLSSCLCFFLAYRLLPAHLLEPFPVASASLQATRAPRPPAKTPPIKSTARALLHPSVVCCCRSRLSFKGLTAGAQGMFIAL